MSLTDAERTALLYRQVAVRRTGWFTPLTLHNRQLGSFARPGELDPAATARAEDLNDIQWRVIDGVAGFSWAVEGALDALQVVVAQEAVRLRRLQTDFEYRTHVTGTPDPNAADLLDRTAQALGSTLDARRSTLTAALNAVMASVDAAVTKLENDLYAHWQAELADAVAIAQAYDTRRMLDILRLLALAVPDPVLTILGGSTDHLTRPDIDRVDQQWELVRPTPIYRVFAGAEVIVPEVAPAFAYSFVIPPPTKVVVVMEGKDAGQGRERATVEKK